MLKQLVAVILPLLMAVPAVAAPGDVEVMVLGTYHFGNPGLDINNMQAEDVRTPRRQAELEALSEALLTFKPTKVMVESVVDTPALEDVRYRDFTAAQLKESTNETVQIGYRVARAAGLSTVHAIDEQPKPGEPDYFPYGTLMKEADRLGQKAVLDANAGVQAFLKTFEASQSKNTIAELLAIMNADEHEQMRSFYYRTLAIGDTDSQPGADLNAMWYLRNAKIFGKLMKVAKPGDRVLVVYGSGHNYWLRHFARETPGFVSVDPLPYLRKAAGQSR